MKSKPCNNLVPLHASCGWSTGGYTYKMWLHSWLLFKFPKIFLSMQVLWAHY